VRRLTQQAAKQQPATSSTTTTGRCWLVGAGPGSPEYLTIKAANLLKAADVVIYDDLGAQGVLDLVPKEAECIYVGKRGGKASYKQSQIDQLLVDYCTKGREVIRLKGGCPSVFSRVSSEASALAAAAATMAAAAAA